MHTKKQNEIIFQSVAKNAEKSAFFAFCGKFYLEGCVYFRFFAFYVKHVHLKAVLCGVFCFSCIFSPNVAILQFFVTCQAFFANFLCDINAVFRETAISEKFAETLCVVLFSLLGQRGAVESSLMWHFFAFLAFFRLTLLNSQLCVDGQTFSQILSDVLSA